MTISQARAFGGLRIVATPTASLTTNDQIIGIANFNTSLADANTGFANQSLIVGAGSSLVMNLSTNSSSGSTAWTDGAAQVETATASGTITATGNATITVTAAGMTGSPKAISVAVTNGDTATVWAGKVRTALAADTDVSALFTVGGTTTSIAITRKPLGTYAVGSASVSTYPANDATLNIASTNGTCTGITPASSSANTTSGVLSAGCYILDGDTEDFEGVALTAIAANRMGSYLIRNESTSGSNVLVSTAATLVNHPIPVAGSLQLIAPSVNAALQTVTITAASSSVVSIVAAGSTV